MAIKQRVNWIGSMRVDKPHLMGLEDGVIFDFKTLIQSFNSNSPYILRGFEIHNPGAAINTSASNLQLVVDSGVVWAPDQADGSFLVVPAGTPNEILNSSNTKLIGAFTPNATNYLSLKFERVADPTTNDLVAIWDVDAKVEFNKTIPLGLVLNYKLVLNTSGFGSNIPLAIINTDPSNNVISITNCKPGLFRLGKGGTNPNPSYSWSYSVLPENPLTLNSSGGPSPFVGGDWQIKTFKEWMDAVMTEIKLVKGSAYWYSFGSSSLPGVNLTDTWFDSNGSLMTGIGKFIHDDATAGLLTWSSPIFIRSVLGPLTYTIQPGSVSMSDGDVAYIQIQRDVDFQPTNTFTFTNGLGLVTATAPVSGISVGDYIKFEGHDIGKYVKVVSISGTTITLASPYLGATAIGKAVSAVGNYTISVASPTSIPVNADVYWIAKRDDNTVPSATIETPSNGGATRSNDIATIKTTAPHSFVPGQTVSISGVSDASFNNVVEIIAVPTSTTFTYLNPGPDVLVGGAGNGTVVSRAKIYLRGLGELTQGEERQISDNTLFNILTFIGSESETDITPPYTILPNSFAPYTFNTNNNLTQAISALTGNINSILTVLNQPTYDETYVVTNNTTAHVHATQTTGGSASSIQSSSHRIGQSFVATTSNLLNSVVVRMRKVGTPNCDIICEIYEDNLGQPGTLIQNGTHLIPANTLTTSFANYTFNLGPTHVLNGNTYWLVIRTINVTSLNASNYIELENNNFNPYSSGNEAFYNGTVWTNLLTSDLYFTVNSYTMPTNEIFPAPPNSIIRIPRNSRFLSTPQQTYKVGNANLQLFLNGQFLRLNGINTWDEIGTAPNESSLVLIKQGLVLDDQLTFRIDVAGGPSSHAPDDDFYYTLPTESSSDDLDYLLIFDISAGAYKKQTKQNFLAGVSKIRTVHTISTNTVLNSSHDHIRVNCSGGNVTLTLPPAALNIGLQYTIKKIDASSNYVILNAGSDTIDGLSSLSYNVQYQSYTIVASAPGVWDIV